MVDVALILLIFQWWEKVSVYLSTLANKPEYPKIHCYTAEEMVTELSGVKITLDISLAC